MEIHYMEWGSAKITIIVLCMLIFMASLIFCKSFIDDTILL